LILPLDPSNWENNLDFDIDNPVLLYVIYNCNIRFYLLLTSWLFREAFVKPIKIGIDEHEQKGVIVPSRAPTTLAPIPLNLLNIFLVLSTVKYVCTYDDKYINTDNNKNIFITSNIKKDKLLYKYDSASILNTLINKSFTKS
jgi:hypothetical protein